MMYKLCPICKKKIKIGEICECQLDKKKDTHNKWQKKYYEDNKDELKLINNSKWKKLRKLTIERDGGYCQRCFKKFNIFNSDNLQVHHIKPRSEYPELVYDSKNLVTVCRRCNLELGTSEVLDFEFEARDNDFKLR